MHLLISPSTRQMAEITDSPRQYQNLLQPTAETMSGYGQLDRILIYSLVRLAYFRETYFLGYVIPMLYLCYHGNCIVR